MPGLGFDTIVKAFSGEEFSEWVAESNSFVALDRSAGESFLDFVPREVWDDLGDVNNTLDLAASFAQAITDVPSGTLFLPLGFLNTSAAIPTHGLQGLVWRGQGASFGNFGTKIRARSASPIDILDVAGCRDCQFENFSIEGSSTYPISSAVKLSNLTSYTSASNWFTRVLVQGTEDGGCQYGFRMVQGDFIGNNSEHRFTGCSVEWYNEAAYSIEESQSQAHVFDGCEFGGHSVGLNGVRQVNGNYTFRSGGGGGNTDADFLVTQPNRPILISGPILETSARLLRCASRNRSFQPITLENITWAIQPDYLAGDGRIIYYAGRGPFIVRGCCFESHDELEDISVYLDYVVESAMGVTIENNYFATSSTDPIQGVDATARAQVTQFENTICRDIGGVPILSLEDDLYGSRMALGGRPVVTMDPP